MDIHRPILRRLLLSPARTVITDDQRTWRAAEVLAAALHIASIIDRTARSPHVAVMLPPSGTFAAAALAVWMTGRVLVPLNYLLKPQELQYVIDDCGADAVLTATPLLDHLGAPPRAEHVIRLDKAGIAGVPEPRWPARAEPGDLVVILYTSGTSGRPKGVMLTHGNLSANVRQCIEGAGFIAQDVVLGVLPAFHSFGLTVLTLLPLTVGAPLICSARFLPPRIVKLCREHRPTALVAIPSMYNALLSVKDARPEDFASLRFTVSGGEPLPQSVAHRFRERFGKQINEGYGLTETSPVTHWCLPHERIPRSVGRALPGIQTRIVDWNTGRTLPPGADGEIRLKGPNIMRGYYKLPEQTAAVFDEHGWFKTGDIGRLSADGHLFITGRLKEMIIVGGENVFPREIEEVLDRHPMVKASAVIGVHDEVRGELPWAFVELRDGEAFDEAALRSWCREHLAGYKVPREIVHLAALPRNPTGKIMRRELIPIAKEMNEKGAQPRCA